MVVKTQKKKKQGATRNPPPSTSNWSWGLIGLSLGCFIALLVYLDKIPTISSEEAVINQSNKPDNILQHQKESQDLEDKTPKKHQFEFYSVLPQRKFEVEYNNEDDIDTDVDKNIIVKNSAVQTSDKIPIIDNKTTPVQVTTEFKNPVEIRPDTYDKNMNKTDTRKSKNSSLYQLQVGAFNALSKANARKLQLAFIGIESNIQMINNQGEKMYRLRVGPSSDEQYIKNTQKKLQTKNISSFIHKLNDA
ncbi:MAG: SPOR domain-containing protein [Gammaproteobacteria bacterium]|nr:SPOR domain-containing protein [Gammaproteobacteria bacterium]